MREQLRATSTISLATVEPSATPGFDGGKKQGEKALADGAKELATLQEQLFAESRFGGTRSILVVLQAMDTAGKGGAVRHAFAGADPAGIHSVAFKAPTDEEKRHDFLWRIRPHLPGPGYIGVFDRSHYEDVLIHRVHGFSTPEAIEERYGIINDFEAEVEAAGTTIIKVMLHISSAEQKSRLAERLERPDKHWKFSLGDLEERSFWTAYQEAYEIAIRRTSTTLAPWYVVPANHKWYARLAVQNLVLEELRAMDLQWPVANFDVEEAKARLDAS
ncbi:MAG: polyphosphate kinase 2 family protein [Glaciihabitans sp.]|nr:polyphosphate kinase 2 family protein [Glaciihabitans sp.]